MIVVVGAGPAGLMAAGRAAGLGAEVLILEKMPKPGLKLGLTGKGRCNLTNTAPLSEFITAFGPGGRFLHPAFSRFFCPELREFLDTQGVQTHVERGGRVFPAGEHAPLVARTLRRWAEKAGARLRTGARVVEMAAENGRVCGVWIETRDGSREYIHAERVILATGGASYPRTGSTGEGYDLARKAGHTVSPIFPALVPLVVREEDVIGRIQGLSLRNVRLQLEAKGKRLGEEFGEMLFTHFGLSGPIVLSLSLAAVKALDRGDEVIAHVDLKPALEESKLDARLVRDFRGRGKQQLRTILKGLLPQSLIPVCLEQTGLDPAKRGNQLSGNDRRILRSWLKDVRFTVTGHRSFAEAIVTAGGVVTKEVDPRSMESKILPGLHLAGEVLDVAAGTGGYNLQAAFSTGWLAGQSSAGRLG